MTLEDRWEKQKQIAKDEKAWRSQHCRGEQKSQSMQISLNGKDCINFCSNDYLGLAQSDQIKQAFQQGLDQYGTGSGGSPLVSGYTLPHETLEKKLAEFLERDRVLLFSTGFAANIGTISSIIDEKDHVLLDKYCHASIIDGLKLSGVKSLRYQHADHDALNRRLDQMERDEGSDQQSWLITESVFSMDGDQADLGFLSDLVKKEQMNLYVDDAHGLGWRGNQGRGSLDHYKLSQEEVPVLIGTFGKAFGGAGAFVAGCEAMIETMINSNRAYIYSTAFPPAQAVAMSSAIECVRKDEWRRESLFENIERFKKLASESGIELFNDADGPIQPILIGSNDKTLKVSKYLLESGYYVSAIRPPTVPQGKARLRITLTSLHSETQIRGLIECLSAAMKEVNAV